MLCRGNAPRKHWEGSKIVFSEIKKGMHDQLSIQTGTYLGLKFNLAFGAQRGAHADDPRIPLEPLEGPVCQFGTRKVLQAAQL